MPPRDPVRTLQTSDFFFHGFDSLMDQLGPWLAEVGIRSGTPRITVVGDAVYVPTAKVPAVDRTPGRFVFEGGLVTRDGQPVAAAQSHRQVGRWGLRVLGGFSEPVTFTPKAEVDEEVVYLGWHFDHFGHFLLESLARTWALAEVDPSIPVVFHLRRQRPPEGITRQMLEAFGVPFERIRWFERPTLLRRVLIPEPLYELSYSAHERMVERYREVAADIAGEEVPSTQPVYLSRRLLPSGLRRIIGELELEETLRENGFLVVHTETMSFEDQVRLVNQHRDILTSAGSAAYLSLFARQQPRLHIMTDGIPRPDYFLIPALIGAEASYVNCLGGDLPTINTTPLLLDLETLFAYLDTRSLLNRRLRSSLAYHAPTMRAEYEEAWCYASVRDVPRGEPLPADLEAEALSRARSSWPINMILAQHYHFRSETSRVDELVRQMASLLADETDVGRLAHYHDDAAAIWTRVFAHCQPEVTGQLADVYRHRLQIDPATIRPRGGRRHEAR